MRNLLDVFNDCTLIENDKFNIILRKSILYDLIREYGVTSIIVKHEHQKELEERMEDYFKGYINVPINLIDVMEDED